MMFMPNWKPMPQTQSFTHPHEIPSERMAASLVLSPALHSQQQEHSSPSRPGRPKLSLNIAHAQTRTFGKGSSLRLETLSAISPTIINTFSNAYEPVSQPPASTTEQKPMRPKLSIDSAIQYTAPGTPTSNPETQDSRTPSSASISSASTTHSATLPYSNSQVLNSVLANSPIPRLEPRRMATKPRFPAEKRVSFRNPLEEEITTSRFTFAHSDIESQNSSSTLSLSTESLSSEDNVLESTSLASFESSGDSTSSSDSPRRSEGSYLKMSKTNTSTASPSSSSSLPSPSSPGKRRLPHRTIRNRLKPRSPRTGDKRDSSSESDSDTCPQTPVAGRRKLNREWVWTLGTLPGQSSFEDTHSLSTDESNSTTTTTSFTSSIISSQGSDDSS